MRMTRTGLALSLAVGGALALAACQAPAASPTAAATTAPKTAATAPASAATAVPTVAAAAKPVGTIRVATPGATRTLDPLDIVGTPLGAEPGWAIADPLLIVDRDGSLKPELASSWKAPTDGLTWTFTMRPGVKFSDGTPLTARDVKATFDGFLNPANAYSQAPRISAFLDTTTAVDDMTFTIKTRTPDAILARRIASVMIMKADTYTTFGGKATMATKAPITTGMFTVKAFQSSVSSELEANPNSWRQPKAQTLKFAGVSEEAIRVGALRNNEIDIISMIPDSVDQAKGAGKTVATLETASNTVMLMDSASPDAFAGFKDKRVREAMNISLDRQSLVGNLTNSLGRASSVAVAPQAFGYIALPDYVFNPQRAQQLVRDAGFAGATVKLTGSFAIATGLSTRDGVQAISAQLSQSGIRVDLDGLEQGIFQQRYSAGGLAPLMIFPLGASNNDADGAILNFRTETNTAPATIRYTNPEFDKAYLASRVEVDEAKRKVLLQQALKVLYDDYALIPVGNTPSIWGLQPGVKSFTPKSTFNWNWDQLTIQ